MDFCENFFTGSYQKELILKGDCEAGKGLAMPDPNRDTYDQTE